MNKADTGQLKTLQNRHQVALDQLDKYKLLVESVEDYAIFLMDTEGYIQTWNKGAEKNKGWTAEEIIGKHFSTFYTQRDIDARKPELELEIATKHGRVEDEDWRIRKDGTKFWANVVITALYNEQGELVGFAKVTRNLTERKQHEDDLRNANATLKIQQTELRALNVAKDEFVSLASHQLRTPATGIKQLLGLLLEGFVGPLDEHHAKVLRKAYETNERQLMIVENLLRVAQLDAGKVVLKNNVVDLGGMLQNLVENHRETFEERGQTIQYTAPKAKQVIAIVDSRYLPMALENIIDNASKYTHRDGEITVRLTQDKDFLKIAIEDNGVGISDNDQAKLFQRFSRIPNDLSEVVGGSGLGLFWSGKIIDLHGGHIEVESQLDKGTTFTIYMPKEKLDA